MPNRGVFGEGTMKSGSAAKGKEVNRWNRKQEAGEASGISGDLCLSNWELQMTGGDADAMMQIAQSTAQSGKLYDQITNELMNWAVYIEGVAALITIPVMLFLFHRDSRKEKELGIVTEKASIWKYIAIIVMFAVMALGLNNLIFLSNLSAASETYSDTMQTLYGQGFAVQILVLGILMPTCEELVYRGLVYKRLRYTSPFWAAALYSSLVFAFTHGNLVQGLYGFIMGMMFCYVYEKYGSVKAPILAHITANILSVVGTQFQWFDWLFKDPMRVGISTVLCAFITSSIYVMIQRLNTDTTKNNSQNEG